LHWPIWEFQVNEFKDFANNPIKFTTNDYFSSRLTSRRNRSERRVSYATKPANTDETIATVTMEGTMSAIGVAAHASAAATSRPGKNHDPRLGNAVSGNYVGQP
jgi:hypothetical protein